MFRIILILLATLSSPHTVSRAQIGPHRYATCVSPAHYGPGVETGPGVCAYPWHHGIRMDALSWDGRLLARVTVR